MKKINKDKLIYRFLCIECIYNLFFNVRPVFKIVLPINILRVQDFQLFFPCTKCLNKITWPKRRNFGYSLCYYISKKSFCFSFDFFNPIYFFSIFYEIYSIILSYNNHKDKQSLFWYTKIIQVFDDIYTPNVEIFNRLKIFIICDKNNNNRQIWEWTFWKHERCLIAEENALFLINKHKNLCTSFVIRSRKNKYIA